MKKLKMTLLGLSALVAFSAAGTVTTADADVRFRATVKTPHAKVSFGNTHTIYGRGHRHTGWQRPYIITHRDRKIARRLSNYTGVRRAKLIKLRRAGIKWFQIGRIIHVRRPVIRAAMTQRSWVRFIRQQDRCGTTVRYKDRVVAQFDTDGYIGNNFDDDEYGDD